MFFVAVRKMADACKIGQIELQDSDRRFGVVIEDLPFGVFAFDQIPDRQEDRKAPASEHIGSFPSDSAIAACDDSDFMIDILQEIISFLKTILTARAFYFYLVYPI